MVPVSNRVGWLVAVHEILNYSLPREGEGGKERVQESIT